MGPVATDFPLTDRGHELAPRLFRNPVSTLSMPSGEWTASCLAMNPRCGDEETAVEGIILGNGGYGGGSGRESSLAEASPRSCCTYPRTHWGNESVLVSKFSRIPQRGQEPPWTDSNEARVTPSTPSVGRGTR